MAKFYLTFLFTVFITGAFGQVFSIEDLVTLTSYPASKFDNYISKKGFRNIAPGASADSLSYTYFTKKGKTVTPSDIQMVKCDKADKTSLSYVTPSEEDFEKLKKELEEEGFRYGKSKETDFYQKANIVVKPYTAVEEDKKLYGFVVEKKALPKARDILFAEDFLQLTSHEYLTAVFGEANVKKDQFYFSEKEINKCSVLFPNTNLQVIFIWKDEANSKDIAFIMIGGQVRAQSSANYYKQIEMNAWHSKQGIESGMSLRELQRLNNNTINIYGWDTDQPGLVAPKNTGDINFKNITLVLNCLDCNEDKYYTKNNIINSADLLAENRRVYVSTIIIFPEGK